MDLTRTIVFAAALLLFMLSLGYVFAGETPAAEPRNTPPSKEVRKARGKEMEERDAALDRSFRARAAQKSRAARACVIKPVMSDREIDACRRVTASRRFVT